MRNDSIKIPYISIKPHKIVCYEVDENRTYKRGRNRNSLENLLNNKHNGIISKKAQTGIIDAINWQLKLAKEKTFYSKEHERYFKFKVNFITLTLASKQIHPDKVIKSELLNHLLTVLREKYKFKNYVWRAEAQKNGNIHFHITGDQYIHYNELRDHWNKIQNKLGYVNRFFDKHGHYDPPTTEVKATKKVKKLPRYLAKYCTKQNIYVIEALKNNDSNRVQVRINSRKINYDCIFKYIKVVCPECEKQITIYKSNVIASIENDVDPCRVKCNCCKKPILLNFKYRPIEGKLWGLSYPLSRIKTVLLNPDYNINQEILKLWNKYPERIKIYDYATVFHISIDEIKRTINGVLVSAFNNYLEEHLQPVPI